MRMFLAAGLVCLNCVAVGLGDGASLELARQLPPGANAMAIIRVRSLLESPRAEAEGWRLKQEERFLSGAAAISPDIDLLVVGGLLRPGGAGAAWTAAVMRLPIGVNMEGVAKHAGAPIEQLAGRPAVRGRREAYLALLTPDVLGAYSPASRQEAARWVGGLAQTSPASLSRYLQEATQREGKIVLAMDLEHLLDPQLVERHLREDDRFQSHRKLISKLTPLIAGMQGVTFAIDVNEEAKGRLSIDFSQAPGESVFAVKALFLSALEDLGAAIEEFEACEATAEGNSVVLECGLSDASLRRVLSLVAPPSSAAIAAEPKPAAAPAPKTPKAPPARPPLDPQQATQKYIAAVNQMISDLQQANRRAKEYGRTATWHDNFANKIEALDVTGVAPEAVDYGSRTASRFRALAASLRGQGVAVNAQQQTLTYNVSRDPGWGAVSIWGGAGWRNPTTTVTSNIQEVREKQAVAVAEGAKAREEIWGMILNDRAAMEKRFR